MPSVLITASTFSHIVNFHLPYLRRFRELGWQVDVACGGAMRDIPFADVTAALPLEKKMSSPANLRAAKLLRGMMEREHYDLVITHTSLASFFTRWAARGMKNRPPIVNVMHGYLFTDETPAVKKLLLTRAAGAALGRSTVWYLLLDNFVIVACSEELAKLLPVRLAAWDHPAFDYRFDAVVYSVSSALGFAAVENILYVMQSDLRTAVSRAILSVPGHFFFAVSMGLLLSRAKQAECCGQLRRRRMLALAVPTLLHGLWDFLLAAGSRWAVIAFYAFVAAFFITADVCLRRASRTDSRL